MGSFHIIVSEPIHKSHFKIFMRGEAIFIPEIIIDNFPESLYLPIGLRTSNLCVFVDDSELLKCNLKAMFAP